MSSKNKAYDLRVEAHRVDQTRGGLECLFCAIVGVMVELVEVPKSSELVAPVGAGHRLVTRRPYDARTRRTGDKLETSDTFKRISLSHPHINELGAQSLASSVAQEIADVSLAVARRYVLL